MAEEVHVHQTPPAGGDGSGGAGWMVAVLVIIVLAGVLFFAFGRGDNTGGVPDRIEADIDVNLPDAPDPRPDPGGNP
jgi:hypothetical protein